MGQLCGILVGSGLIVGADDCHGCLLPLNHKGAHEFVDHNGKHWLWETDLECDCEHCMECSGDYCIIYWPKPVAAAELRARIQKEAPEVDPRQISLF